METRTTLSAVLAGCLVLGCGGDVMRQRTDYQVVDSSAATDGMDGTGSSGDDDATDSGSGSDAPPTDAETGSSGTEQSGSSGGGESSTGETSPEVLLPCDLEFTFLPAQPGGGVFFVEVTDPTPLVHVGLTLFGPTLVEGEFVAVVGENPWAWRFSVEGHLPGTHEVAFSSSETANGPRTTHSMCLLEITPIEE